MAGLAGLAMSIGSDQARSPTRARAGGMADDISQWRWPTRMSRERLRAALVRHIEAERARDLDAIMTSLHPDPWYIIPGYEVRGGDAVRALYDYAMPALTPENADEY